MRKFLILFVFSCISLVKGFPENLTPRIPHYDPPTHIFTGNKDGRSAQSLFVQSLKTLRFGSVTRIAVAARENLYLLDPYSLHVTNKSVSYKENFSWKSNEEASNLCLMKGQSPELCRNYLSVLELPSNDEMLLCGTNAFDPKCRNCSISITNNFISFEPKGDEMSGRQRSPFGPNQPSTSLFTDGSLYSATYQSFFGGMAILSRTMGASPALRTDSNTAVMNKPQFIKMIDDGKRLLIFFNEVEILAAGDERIIPKVAQVCKNDKGGDIILQGLFISFIKSRLNCSYNGFYLNQLTDVTDPINVDGELTLFATFATPENSLAGSAVCSFTLSSIQATLAGPFFIPDTEEPLGAQSKLSSSSHPGMCPSKPLTDDEMLFVKSHPQLQKQVPGALLFTDQGQRWTSIQVQNINGQKENVVFLGTENGKIVRALSLSSDFKQGLLLSSQDVFSKERCQSKQPQKNDRRILKILIENEIIFVAFKHCIVTLPLQWCAEYGCEFACRGSGDPYCGWNGTYCVGLSRPVPQTEKLLKSESFSSIVCPQNGLSSTQAAEVGISELVDSKKAKSTTTHNDQPPISPAELEAPLEKLYPVWFLLVVGLGTFLMTMIMVAVVVVACRFCGKKEKSQKEDNFKKKQTDEIHQLTQNEDKLNSLQRQVQKLLHKATTPIHTPQITLKSEKTSRQSCRPNVYTDAPCFKKPGGNETKTSRNSGRLNSASSVSSRQDHFSSFAPTQPLLAPTQESHDLTAEEATLPRHISDAPTIRHVSRVTSDVSTTPSSSPTRSSLNSPMTTQIADVAPETSTASAQLRSRSERAARQTTEIMRDSNKAIRDFENTVERLEEQGIANLAPIQTDARTRIESNDSGKGESPRNSLKTETTRSETAKASRMQRPISLNVRQNKSNHRHRLLSEGSSPHETNMPIARPQRGRERHFSGQQLMHAQATTPVNGPQQAGGGFVQLVHPMYGSLQRHNNPMDVPVQKQQVHYSPASPGAFYSPHQEQPYQHHHSSKLQRQMSEPHNHVKSTRVFPGSVSPPKPYHAFQEAAPPHRMLVHANSTKATNHMEKPGPTNYYPSLPCKSSSSPYGDTNSYSTGAGFKQTTNLQRPEKIPPLMRQMSTPIGTRAAIFVPTSGISGNEMV